MLVGTDGHTTVGAEPGADYWLHRMQTLRAVRNVEVIYHLPARCPRRVSAFAIATMIQTGIHSPNVKTLNNR